MMILQQTLIGKIFRQNLDINLLMKKGDPIAYTNDKAGLKKYTLDTFNQYKSNVEKNVLNDFFDGK